MKQMKKRTEYKISVNGKILEQVNEVVYLGSMFGRDKRYEMDVERRTAAGDRINRALAALMRRRNVSEVSLFGRTKYAVLVPTLLYGSDKKAFILLLLLFFCNTHGITVEE